MWESIKFHALLQIDESIMQAVGEFILCPVGGARKALVLVKNRRVREVGAEMREATPAIVVTWTGLNESFESANHLSYDKKGMWMYTECAFILVIKGIVFSCQDSM